MKRTARILDMSNPRVRDGVLLTAKEAKGFWWVTLEKFHPTRTLKQNSYWWSVCIPALSDFLTEGSGSYWDEEDSHDFAKRAWLPPVVRRLPDGGEYRTPMSTKDLTTKDFAALVDGLILFLAENGVEVPEPSRFTKGTE